MAVPRRSLHVAALVAALGLPAGTVAHGPGTRAPTGPETVLTGVVTPIHGHTRAGSSLDLSTIRTPTGVVRIRLGARSIPAGSLARVVVRPSAGGPPMVTGVRILRRPSRPGVRVRASHGPGGARSVAFIQVVFAEGVPPVASAGRLRQILTADADSAGAFFRRESYEKVGFTGLREPGGDVFGPFTVPASLGTCDYARWTAQASALAAERGVDLGGYDHMVFVWPDVPSCSFVGLAETPGRIAWMNGRVGALELAHELGHNLGLQHANLLTCSDQAGRRVAISASCRSIEQRDPFDVMGNGYRSIGAWSRLKLGWAAGSDFLTVTRSGSYRLAPVTRRGTGPIGIALRRCGTGDVYSIEYRDLAAFGQPAASTEGGAVVVRVHPLADGIWRSQLLDATPQTPSHLDGTLAPGATLVDPVEQITIATVATGPDGADVQVTMPESTGPATPQALVGSAVVASGSATVQLRWSPAPDCGAVHAYHVERNGVRLATTASPRFVDERVPVGVQLSYSVVATDAAGNLGRPATVSVSTADLDPPDRPGPIEVRQLASGRTSLTWGPSGDNVGVIAYRIERDGAAIGRTQATTFVDAKPPARVTTYQVVAVDAAGNRSDASRATAAVTTAGARLLAAPDLLKRRPDLRPAGRTQVALSMRVNGPSRGRCRAEVRVGRTWRPASRAVPYVGRRCNVVLSRPAPKSLLRVAVVRAGRGAVAVSRPVRAFLD